MIVVSAHFYKDAQISVRFLQKKSEGVWSVNSPRLRVPGAAGARPVLTDPLPSRALLRSYLGECVDVTVS